MDILNSNLKELIIEKISINNKFLFDHTILNKSLPPIKSILILFSPNINPTCFHFYEQLDIDPLLKDSYLAYNLYCHNSKYLTTSIHTRNSLRDQPYFKILFLNGFHLDIFYQYLDWFDLFATAELFYYYKYLKVISEQLLLPITKKKINWLISKYPNLKISVYSLNYSIYSRYNKILDDYNLISEYVQKLIAENIKEQIIIIKLKIRFKLFEHLEKNMQVINFNEFPIIENIYILKELLFNERRFTADKNDPNLEIKRKLSQTILASLTEKNQLNLIESLFKEFLGENLTKQILDILDKYLDFEKVQFSNHFYELIISYLSIFNFKDFLKKIIIHPQFHLPNKRLVEVLKSTQLVPEILKSKNFKLLELVENKPLFWHFKSNYYQDESVLNQLLKLENFNLYQPNKKGEDIFAVMEKEEVNVSFYEKIMTHPEKLKRIGKMDLLKVIEEWKSINVIIKYFEYLNQKEGVDLNMIVGNGYSFLTKSIVKEEYYLFKKLMDGSKISEKLTLPNFISHKSIDYANLAVLLKYDIHHKSALTYILLKGYISDFVRYCLMHNLHKEKILGYFIYSFNLENIKNLLNLNLLNKMDIYPFYLRLIKIEHNSLKIYEVLDLLIDFLKNASSSSIPPLWLDEVESYQIKELFYDRQEQTKLIVFPLERNFNSSCQGHYVNDNLLEFKIKGVEYAFVHRDFNSSQEVSYIRKVGNARKWVKNFEDLAEYQKIGDLHLDPDLILENAVFGNQITQSNEMNEEVRKGKIIKNFALVRTGLKEKMVEKILKKCGLVVDLIEHDINIYLEGDHFAEHVDTPRHDAAKMIGTVVYILYSNVEGGGELICQEKGSNLEESEKEGNLRERKYNLRSGDYVFITGDTVHKVNPIQKGYRISMTFDVILKGDDMSEEKISSELIINNYKERLKNYFLTLLKNKNLVISLENQYSLDALNEKCMKSEYDIKLLKLLDLYDIKYKFVSIYLQEIKKFRVQKPYYRDLSEFIQKDEDESESESESDSGSEEKNESENDESEEDDNESDSESEEDSDDSDEEDDNESDEEDDNDSDEEDDNEVKNEYYEKIDDEGAELNSYNLEALYHKNKKDKDEKDINVNNEESEDYSSDENNSPEKIIYKIDGEYEDSKFQSRHFKAICYDFIGNGFSEEGEFINVLANPIDCEDIVWEKIRGNYAYYHMGNQYDPNIKVYDEKVYHYVGVKII